MEGEERGEKVYKKSFLYTASAHETQSVKKKKCSRDNAEIAPIAEVSTNTTCKKKNRL